MRYFWCELAIVSAFMITFAVEFNSLTIINIRTMVNYKDLGLVNTRDMFAKAIKGGYAIPAFNFNNMEQMQAIIKAAVETKSPVILQVSKGARQYANATLLRYMAQGAVEYAKELGCAKPEIVSEIRNMTDMPIFVSSIVPSELVKAVELGADAIELGNFDVLYKKGMSFSADQVMSLVRETMDMLGDTRTFFCVTIPGELSIADQIDFNHIYHR